MSACPKTSVSPSSGSHSSTFVIARTRSPSVDLQTRSNVAAVPFRAGAKGRSRQRFLTRDPHLAERRERESNSLEDERVDPADRLEGEDHPLTTPSGTNRATIFVSPAPSATRTTSSTFLYAPGASSTIPAREAARR